MHNDETPCKCPKCGWIGMFSDTDRYAPTDADFNELEPRNVCPECTNEVNVQALGQKGLDGLRQEYRLLVKGSYLKAATVEARNERRSHLERFFEHSGQPLDSKNETRQAFEKMMLSGRMNALMTESVREGIAETASKKWKPSGFMTPVRRHASKFLPDDCSDLDVPPEFRDKP